MRTICSKNLSIIFFCSIVQYTYAENSILNLSLDEGRGLVAHDSSGSSNDGSLRGDPVYEADTADGRGYAVRLDGEDDYIDLGALDVRGSGLTLAVWFKADRFPGRNRDPRLISKASGMAADDHVFMLSTIKSGTDTVLRARVRVAGDTTTLIARKAPLEAGVWQHAAMTYDGSKLRLHLNGSEVGKKPLSGTVDVDPTSLVAVGGQPGGEARLFNGWLDDVRILDRALSSAELKKIATKYNAPMATTVDYAVVYGPGSGTSATEPPLTDAQIPQPYSLLQPILAPQPELLLTPESGAASSSLLTPESGAAPSSLLTPESGAAPSSLLTPESGAASSSLLTPESGAALSSLLTPESGAAPSSLLTPESGAAPSSLLTPESGAAPSSLLTPESGAAPSSLLTPESSPRLHSLLTTEQSPQPYSQAALDQKGISLNWEIPALRMDGTLLSLSEISGFEIYYTGEASGESAAVSIEGNQADNHILTGLSPDTYHISVVAIDDDGHRSQLSDIITVDFR